MVWMWFRAAFGASSVAQILAQPVPLYTADPSSVSSQAALSQKQQESSKSKSHLLESSTPWARYGWQRHITYTLNLKILMRKGWADKQTIHCASFFSWLPTAVCRLPVLFAQLQVWADAKTSDALYKLASRSALLPSRQIMPWDNMYFIKLLGMFFIIWSSVRDQ